MHPTCRHVPPRNGSFSMTTVFNPHSPARIAATYPPGPLPMMAKSYLANLVLLRASIPHALFWQIRNVRNLRGTAPHDSTRANYLFSQSRRSAATAQTFLNGAAPQKIMHSRHTPVRV